MNNNLKQGIIFENRQNEAHISDINISNHNRIGEVNYNAFGSKITIINYINNKKMTVMVESKLTTGETLQYIRENANYGAF